MQTTNQNNKLSEYKSNTQGTQTRKVTIYDLSLLHTVRFLAVPDERSPVVAKSLVVGPNWWSYVVLCVWVKDQ